MGRKRRITKEEETLEKMKEQKEEVAAEAASTSSHSEDEEPYLPASPCNEDQSPRLSPSPDGDHEAASHDPTDLLATIKAQKKTLKARSPGVIYLSSIPYNMSVSRLRLMLGKYGELGRVFLRPETYRNSKGTKEKHFVEGWVEYMSKKVAKRVASTLNGAQVGGKRRAKYFDCLWNIKYLHRFKWIHLDEQMRYENEVRKSRLRTEVSAAKRKAAFFAAQVEKGSNLRKLEEAVLKKGGVWEKYQKQINQRSTMKKKTTESDAADNSALLNMIMGE